MKKSVKITVSFMLVAIILLGTGLAAYLLLRKPDNSGDTGNNGNNNNQNNNSGGNETGNNSGAEIYDETDTLVTFIDYIKSLIVTEGEGLYYANDASKIQQNENGDLYVPKMYYYKGENPDNWIQFGKDPVTHKPILWRILTVSNDGIKLIYEGTKTEDNSAPAEDGRIFNSAWDNSGNSLWETTTLKTKLTTWLDEDLTFLNKESYLKPVYWPIGFCQDTNPVTLAQFLSLERKSTVERNLINGEIIAVYPGVTTNKTAIGLINPSNYILSSLSGIEETYNSQNPNLSLEVGKQNFLTKSNYVQWTNTARGSGGNCWHIGAVGRISSSRAENATYGIRPVINLNEFCIYNNGNGTLESPYILDIPKI